MPDTRRARIPTPGHRARLPRRPPARGLCRRRPRDPALQRRRAVRRRPQAAAADVRARRHDGLPRRSLLGTHLPRPRRDRGLPAPLPRRGLRGGEPGAMFVEGPPWATRIAIEFDDYACDAHGTKVRRTAPTTRTRWGVAATRSCSRTPRRSRPSTRASRDYEHHRPGKRRTPPSHDRRDHVLLGHQGAARHGRLRRLRLAVRLSVGHPLPAPQPPAHAARRARRPAQAVDRAHRSRHRRALRLGRQCMRVPATISGASRPRTVAR